MATLSPSTVICAYPDLESQVLGAVRDWGAIVWIGFHCLTIFHKQWVIYALSLWLNLGVSMALGATHLHAVEAPDPYCHAYLWPVFPSPTIVSVWIIVGWGLWYVVLWRRPVNMYLLFVGLGLGAIVPAILVRAHLTRAWQATVAALLGFAWAGILAGAIRLGGHLVWGHVRHSTFVWGLGMRSDTWSVPPPAEPGMFTWDVWSWGKKKESAA